MASLLTSCVEQDTMRKCAGLSVIAGSYKARKWHIQSEVNKIKGYKNIIATSLDGEVDEKRIADVFATKYRHLYNSVSYDPHEMENVKNDVDACITQTVTGADTCIPFTMS